MCTIWLYNKAALGLQSGKYDNHVSRRATSKYRWLSLNTSVAGKITQNMTEHITNHHRENKKPFQGPSSVIFKKLRFLQHFSKWLKFSLFKIANEVFSCKLVEGT